MKAEISFSLPPFSMNTTLNLIRIHLKVTSLWRSPSLCVDEALQLYMWVLLLTRTRAERCEGAVVVRAPGCPSRAESASTNPSLQYITRIVLILKREERHPKLFRDNAITNERTNILDLFIIPFAGIVFFCKTMLSAGVAQNRCRSTQV